MKKTVFTLLLILSYLTTFAQNTKWSEYGKFFTPKKELRIMIIFVSFNNWEEDPNNTDWPANSMLPVWADSNYLYSNLNDFITQDSNNTGLSNYFYQMSKHLPDSNRLKIYGEYIPIKINLPDDNPGSWININRIVVDSLSQNNQIMENLAIYDNRTHYGEYKEDNFYSSDSVIDFTIFYYRKPNGYVYPLYNGMENWCGSGGGCTPTTIDSCTFSNNYKLKEFIIATGTSAAKNVIHELGHAMFKDCHYGGANAVNYPNLHTTKMGGMIPSMTCEVYSGANAWERWYLGWIDIKHDLTENDPNGIYELDDYFTTGDAIRIKLPNSNQYLWLENHQRKTIFDGRIDYTTHICGSDTLPSSPRGLLIYTENITDDKSTGDVFDKGNGIKLLHSKGNYDIDTCGWVQTTDWSILCNNKTPKFKLKKPNPYSGYSKISHHYLDYNDNQSITYSTSDNEGSKECYEITILNDSLISGDTAFSVIYGSFGSDCAFQVGDSIGIATNPPITNLQKYTLSKRLLSPIFLEGVSIKIISQDSTGKMRIRINFDDYDINNDIRMCGDIVFPPNKININAKIDIDKSNTINRTKKDTTLNIIDFINPSIVKTQNGTELVINDNSRITVKNKSILLIDDSSSLTINNGGILQIDSGACLIVKKDANIDIKNYGRLVINDGAYVCISPSSNINLNTYGILSFSENVNATATDYARYRNLENNHCTSLDSLNIIGCGFIGNIATIDCLDSVVTWNTEKIIAQNLTIDSGQTLRIENTTLSVAANKGIVIKAGGKIVVNNSEITNYKKSCLYNDYWNGIRLEGNKNLSQTETNQGVVELNNALISDARDAISVIGENSDWNKTGGIIKAKNTTFKNNRRSIEFMSYGEGSNINNVSYFRNCTFTWDDDLIPNTSTSLAHITMYQVRGVEVSGCTFKDERTDIPSSTHGLLTLESGFNVNNYNTTDAQFNNLTFGIKTDNSGTRLCDIENAEFTNNYCGINTTTSNNLVITNNVFNIRPKTFTLGGLNGTHIDAEALGVFVESSPYPNISYNDFIGTSRPYSLVGLQVKNSGATNSVVNNNSFSSLYAGTQALGYNRGITQGFITKGLQYRCNSFSNCNRGIFVTDYGETYSSLQSGIHPNQGSMTQPANNTFTSNSFLVNNDRKDISNFSLNSLTYYYYGLTPPSNCVNVTLTQATSSGNSCGTIGYEENRNLIAESYSDDNTEESIIDSRTVFDRINTCIENRNYATAKTMLQNIASTTDEAEEVSDYITYITKIEEFGNSYNIPDNDLIGLASHNTQVGKKASAMVYFKNINRDYLPRVVKEEDNTQDSDTTAIINKMKQQNDYSNLATDDEYTLSPNPANSEVVVKGTKEIREITILDLQGKELKTFYNTEKFNISFLKNGTYIVRIKDSENKVHYQKLVKQ